MVPNGFLGDHHLEPGILYHNGETLIGISRIQWNVGATGFENAESTHDRL